MRNLILSGIIGGVALASLGAYAYAQLSNPREGEITSFYAGHSHVDGETLGGPAHSGGTDSFGCHNGSVPYHCHKPKN